MIRPIRRREAITLLGGAAAAPALAWPRIARAQQAALPVIGYLRAQSSERLERNIAVLRKGLSEMGFAEGRNVILETREANNDYTRLPELAADLVRRRVNVIYTSGGGVSALAAKAATTTIPIVFTM